MTKIQHFYKRPPGHLRGRVGCAVEGCGQRVGMHVSKVEADFDEQVLRAGLTGGMVKELEFARGHAVARGWRFDRAWPALMLAVELDGGTFMAHGGHTTQADRARDNFAQIMGWLVLRFDPQMLKVGLAIQHLTCAIQIRAAAPAQRAALRSVIRPEMFPKPADFKAALEASRKR